MRIVLTLVMTFLAANNWAQSPAERELIRSGMPQEPMRVLLTTSEQDAALLRAKVAQINPLDPDIVHLSKRMLATVNDEKTKGVGIAAPQVGVLANVIWVQRFDLEDHPFQCLYNLTWQPLDSYYQLGPEGCLSIPDRREEVYRHSRIRIKYQSENGDWKEEIISDFTAVIFQHEGDHLIGKLFTDHIEEQLEQTFETSEQGIILKR